MTLRAISGGTAATSWVITPLRGFQSSGTMLVHLAFEIAPEKKNRMGTKSDERGGGGGHRVDIGEPPSIINTSTTNARCSPDQAAAVNTNNGIDQGWATQSY